MKWITLCAAMFFGVNSAAQDVRVPITQPVSKPAGSEIAIVSAGLIATAIAMNHNVIRNDGIGPAAAIGFITFGGVAINIGGRRHR